MVKVNFFALETDYNIKLSNHLVLIQYQFNSYDILEPTVELLQLAIAGSYPPKPQLNKMYTCITSITKPMVFNEYQLPFGLKTAYCLVIKDTKKNYWLTKSINLSNPIRYTYMEQDTSQIVRHMDFPFG